MQRAGLDFTDLNVKNMDQIPVAKMYLCRQFFAIPNVLLTAGLRLLKYVFLNYGNFLTTVDHRGVAITLLSQMFLGGTFIPQISLAKLRTYILTESI